MKKPEPLNGKIVMKIGEPPRYVTLYEKERIRSAVEWLKDKMDYHRKSNDLWRLPEDESWGMVEEWLDEAFADVMEKSEK